MSNLRSVERNSQRMFWVKKHITRSFVGHNRLARMQQSRSARTLQIFCGKPGYLFSPDEQSYVLLTFRNNCWIFFESDNFNLKSLHLLHLKSVLNTIKWIFNFPTCTSKCMWQNSTHKKKKKKKLLWEKSI